MKMSNKKGYTLIEMVVLIVVLGIITVAGSVALSKVYDDKSKEAYDNEISIILRSAANYGQEVKEDIKDSKNGITITVDKLIEKGYIMPSEEGVIIDPRNRKENLNNIKVRITYDIAQDKLNTTIVS